MTATHHYLLVCVNKEHYARNALQYACRTARDHGYTVMILHVIEPAEYKSFGSVAEKMERENRAAADMLITDLIEDVCAPLNVLPTVEIREGYIEECIMRVIEEYDDIAMLIIGSSSETSLSKSKVVPPLAAAVGGKVRVPLLIVPGKAKGEEEEQQKAPEQETENAGADTGDTPS